MLYYAFLNTHNQLKVWKFGATHQEMFSKSSIGIYCVISSKWLILKVKIGISLDLHSLWLVGITSHEFMNRPKMYAHYKRIIKNYLNSIKALHLYQINTILQFLNSNWPTYVNLIPTGLELILEFSGISSHICLFSCTMWSAKIGIIVLLSLKFALLYIEKQSVAPLI